MAVSDRKRVGRAENALGFNALVTSWSEILRQAGSPGLGPPGAWVMSPVGYEVRDGKARYDGRTLAECVPDVVDLVVAACNPEEVLLFGSVARGDDGPDSDLDLMVVCSSIDYPKRHELETTLYGALGGALPVQVFVTDRRECERRRDVVGSMHYWPLREGRVVYDRAAVDGRYADDLADAEAELASSLAGFAEEEVAGVRRELGAERGRQ